MRRILLAIAVSGVVLFSQACSSVPIFPKNDSPEVKEFGVLVAEPDVYRGRAMKLAGRMIAVENTEKGTLIHAEWLPYPKDGQYGPSTNQIVRQDRFTLLYPGSLDSLGAWKGNRFIMMGKIEGTQDVVASMTGRTKPVPYMVARCLHVWKIGDNLWWDQPDTEPTGYPYLQETYCSKA